MRTITWVKNKWSAFRSNFWFLPTIISIAAVIMCFILLRLDQRMGFMLPESGIGSLGSMRSTLAVLINAIATALSIVFSITVVVLTLAASQHGPRILRTFMRDKRNQALIGIFSATLFYNLIALFVVSRLQEQEGFPPFTVFAGFIMTCVAFFLLIYFIHHVAMSIQASTIIFNVSQELGELIRLTYAKRDENQQDIPKHFVLPLQRMPIYAKKTGYIQAVDVHSLLKIATENNAVIRTLHRPGHFLVQEGQLAEVHSEYLLEEEIISTLEKCFIIGKTRTSTQDVEFVLTEIVEIAVRALSPGINDPFTAQTCIDRLTEALCLIADREDPKVFHYDEDGNIRLILDKPTFERFCDVSFRQIRQYGSNDVYILIHLVGSIKQIMDHTHTQEQKKALWRHVEMVRNAGSRLQEEHDRKDLQRILKELVQNPGLNKIGQQDDFK